MRGFYFLVVSASIFSSLCKSVRATDTIVPSSSLSYGQTLISSGSSFELGFFSPPGSQYRYLGIWYKKIANGTVVWVANRENPLTNDNGFLRLTNEGNLVLFNGEKAIVWSSNSSKSSSNPPVQAQLLDSGNLVVKDKNINGENFYLWQSFDYPSHTLLPGMKLGWTSKTGLNRLLTSWKTQSDPSPGDYTLRIDIRGVPQLVMWKGEKVRVRAGYWNGIRFTGRINENPIQVYQVDFISNQDEVYYTYNLLNQSIVSILSMSQSGYSERSTWIDQKQGWKVFNWLPTNQCDEYNFCGMFGSCNTENTPVCKCLDGFEPRSPVDWNSTNYSGGCNRRTLFECGKGEGFRKFKALKLPDTRNAVADMNMKLGDCEKACLKNCSCIAYALADIRKGNGCLLWFGDLIDIREFSNEGQELYVKMAASELSYTKGLGSKRRLIIIGGVLLISAMLVFFIMWRFLKKKKKKREKQDHNSGKDDEENLELSAFDFDVISTATKDFSSNKKLGEGGFGSVYKGQLTGGQEIAVKRLSKDSIQGLNEFKNEVELIAKLQHRNLVKLLGYSIQGEEKLLIYEYLPNKSLDLFIFDHPGNQLLNWENRYDIIGGIARGLVYLHQDSRLRIIHRDLKASNILLDNEMNPKITDFGLARSFGGDQSEANTNRVVGTYGYMPPEYAVHGHFSVKSDVFSFGVLMLEIVTGKRNRGFQHPDHHLNLLGHAWLQWKNGNPLELIDAPIRNSCVLSQVLKCIHVGLLCVQQSPDDRPCMSSVILMLGSEVVKLPAPKHPGFFTEVTTSQTDSSSSNQQPCSINDITITLLEAR